jgi:hypothetical protein
MPTIECLSGTALAMRFSASIETGGKDSTGTGEKPDIASG